MALWLQSLKTLNHLSMKWFICIPIKEVWEQRQYKALAYAREHFSPEVVRKELEKLLSLAEI